MSERETKDKKRKLTGLSIQDKQTIIRQVKNGHSQADLAKEFEVDRSTINRIVNHQRDQLNKAAEIGINISRKRLKKSTHDVLDRMVHAWFVEARTRFIPVSGDLLQEKARSFAETLKIDNFCASAGWLRNFKNRYDIKMRVLAGEEDAVDANTVQNWKSRIENLCHKYTLDQIHNMDETALFYYAFPDRSLVKKGERGSSWKSIKNRFTLLFCTNATGTDKLSPTLLHTAAKPRDFKSKDLSKLPVAWHKTAKGWNNTYFCTQWLTRLNDDMKLRNRKILLLMDNASCHPKPEWSNVEVVFLPPNCTSKLQPLDGGIIRSFKAKYRKLFFRRVLDVMPRVNNMADLKTHIPLTIVVDYISTAWKEVTRETITNCFAKCYVTNDANNNVAADDNTDQAAVEALVLALDGDADVNDFIAVDGEEEVAETVGDHELDRHVYESVLQGEAAEEEDDEIQVESEGLSVKAVSAAEAISACDKLITFYAGNVEMSKQMILVRKDLGVKCCA